MRGREHLVVRLGLGSLAAALLLAGCARPVDMSLASTHQRPAEFDFLVYQDGWACLSKGTAGREPADTCATGSGRQLRDLFSQRSSARSLRDYLTENGASCRSDSNLATCSYTRTLPEAALVPGGQASTPRGEEGFELTVTFPAKDLGLAPEQIRTTLRRFMRVL